MPIIKSAKKALRQNKKRAKINLGKKLALKSLIKKIKKSKSKKDIAALYSLADKAVKTKILHKNKAARIKSQIAKFVGKN